MYFSPGLGVRIVRKLPDGTRSILKFTQDGGREWQEIEDLVAGGNGVNLTMALEDDEARQLLQELLNHYQGATDMHTVRADLIHERGRVDKMMEHVMSVNAEAVRAFRRD
jgi:hypothetical protein